uniref:Uncharacterized protein n=1 Tax=Escherichia coli TaxID=562 RepID=A0A811AQR8_ECOLX|nr:hypothetical protein [Escherichia coli]
MAIINIYSKRQRKIRGEVNDVYQYNNIPHALRVQIIKIITDSIGFPLLMNATHRIEMKLTKYMHISMRYFLRNMVFFL